MRARVTLIGNEGFRIVAGDLHIYVDAFYSSLLGVAEDPPLATQAVTKADLILVTHPHWDHFNARQVARTARETDATVVGPNTVFRALDGKMSPKRLIEMEPALAEKGPARAQKLRLSQATITAFRTFHSRDHNSYLVEAGGFRLFHDGDNEDTRRIDIDQLGRLDALFIGPWQGSGWVEFIERLAPRQWFVMHLTDEELDQHEAGKFFPGICSRVPKGLVALRPQETFIFE